MGPEAISGTCVVVGISAHQGHALWMGGWANDFSFGDKATERRVAGAGRRQPRPSVDAGQWHSWSLLEPRTSFLEHHSCQPPPTPPCENLARRSQHVSQSGKGAFGVNLLERLALVGQVVLVLVPQPSWTRGILNDSPRSWDQRQGWGHAGDKNDHLEGVGRGQRSPQDSRGPGPHPMSL